MKKIFFFILMGIVAVGSAQTEVTQEKTVEGYTFYTRKVQVAPEVEITTHVVIIPVEKLIGIKDPKVFLLKKGERPEWLFPVRNESLVSQGKIAFRAKKSGFTPIDRGQQVKLVIRDLVAKKTSKVLVVTLKKK